jgi:aminomethyltransferase
VDVKDQTFDTAMVAVQGPRSVGLVAGMFEADVGGVKYYYATPTRYQGQGCVVSRTGYTGEDGFEVMVPNALAVTLWDDLVGRGAVPCGLGARDTLRLEAGMPLYGHELTEQIDPLRAGLGWAVKLDKGPFVGRDALKQAPPGPVRVGLELEGTRAAREGCPILAPDGAPVGTVTSGSFAPWVGKSIAMGYVAPHLAAPGTRLLVDARGTHLPAAVVPLPFYRRPRQEKS